MFPAREVKRAEKVVADFRAKGLTLTVAESCTGGLLAGMITEVPGVSDVFQRGFVTYANSAKTDMIGVPAALFDKFGAVSDQVAQAMAAGALAAAHADLAAAVTGIAGPAGETDKPVGRVHIAIARSDMPPTSTQFDFGDIGRSRVRLQTVASALQMIQQALSEIPPTDV
ncbi:MAG: CinA family protein [Alphaproteobacteria bacterium]|jgi:nicotinamide-nucleotide amidase|nr:CinA family protein [Alphaproteobacteria bacterium]MBT4710486.1 CinA family protein [Alphaproteobacteria bacterium]MBT5859991.1 CinA family protein [Alphaproteobacteria bacterium]